MRKFRTPKEFVQSILKKFGLQESVYAWEGELLPGWKARVPVVRLFNREQYLIKNSTKILHCGTEEGLKVKDPKEYIQWEDVNIGMSDDLHYRIISEKPEDPIMVSYVGRNTDDPYIDGIEQANEDAYLLKGHTEEILYTVILFFSMFDVVNQPGNEERIFINALIGKSVDIPNGCASPRIDAGSFIHGVERYLRPIEFTYPNGKKTGLGESRYILAGILDLILSEFDLTLSQDKSYLLLPEGVVPEWLAQFAQKLQEENRG